MRVTPKGNILKADVPLRFCGYCAKFNNDRKRCEARDTPGDVCMWTIPLAYQFADDLKIKYKLKVNLIAEAIKKSR